MKKLIFGLIAVMFTSILSAQEIKDVTVKKLEDSDSYIKELKQWYLTNTEKLNSIENINFGEAYHVSPNNEVFFYFGLEVFENLSISDKYKVKSYLIDSKLKDEKELKHLKYLQRTITYDDKKIVQLINVTTGDQFDYYLENISEEEYFELNLPSSQSSQSKLICFKSFGSCIRKMTSSLNNPLDQATCDWLPCNTMVYLTCKFGQADGWMQNTSNFVGAGNCSVIY